MKLDHITLQHSALWKIITYIAFSDKDKAIAFEKFLKTGSGRDFAKRRFL